jgi:hypothetical protein
MMAQAARITMLLALATALAGCGGGSDTDRRVPVASASPIPALHPQGPVEDCSTRSMADFGDASVDPANLAVGPLVIVGGATRAPTTVVESHGGQKFPILLRAGHFATVQVPVGARQFASLGYGPLPQGEVGYADGHARVAFVACSGGEPSGSTANGPVTFWSGFVFARKPACVSLDVYVDHRSTPRRAEIELGRRC